MSSCAKVFGYLRRYFIESRYRNNDRRYEYWLFGEWFGKRNGDNSLFLANYVSDNFPEITVYWVSRTNVKVDKLNKRIRIIEYDSIESLEVFKNVGVVFMNQGYVDFSSTGFNYFRGAITVNLWHGVAWKKIGYDASRKRGIVHQINMRLVDYFDGSTRYLSTSEKYSDVLKTAFHAREQQIIKAGYPRNSLFYSKEWIDSNRRKMIRRIQVHTNARVTDSTRIIVYMPTFRDMRKEGYSIECLQDSWEFTKWLEDEDIVIVQKAHFVNQSGTKESSSVSDSLKRVININDIESYEALGCADILITDYSSCFFDYLILDRPIIHYIFDYETYRDDDRGVYYDKEHVVCGETPQDLTSLIIAIKKYIKDPSIDNKLRKIRKNEFMEYEGPDSCKTITNFIFGLL